MKYTLNILFFSFFALSAKAQQLSIVPNSGINFSSISYRAGGKDPASILTYPKWSNINPGMGVDFIYKKNSLKQVLSFSSTPFGMSFKGKINKEGTNEVISTFIYSSAQRQFTLGYQLFKETSISSYTRKYKLAFFYGAGIGIGFNRKREFYEKNSSNVNLAWPSFPQSGIEINGKYSAYRKNIGVYVMPEAGFTLHNKKNKPLLNLSLYYYLGLTPISSFDVNIRYTRSNTSPVFQENQLLKTRGGIFGLKLGVPLKTFQLKK